MSAINWAKDNWKEVLDSLIKEYKPVSSNNPAASFMAGAPGAGKTEYSTRLVSAFSSKPLIIDVDKIKTFIPEYDGTNTDDVKDGAMKILEKILDYSIKNGLPLLLDGTFSGGQSILNLKRVHRSKYDYVAQVYFVYQEPLRAWEFTKARTIDEGRSIPKEYFIRAYTKSIENIKEIELDPEVGSKTTTILIIKDYLEKSKEYTVADSISNLDKYVNKIYNENELRILINDR
jgi:predicted ABC-type ATPase